MVKRRSTKLTCCVDDGDIGTAQADQFKATKPSKTTYIECHIKNEKVRFREPVH